MGVPFSSTFNVEMPFRKPSKKGKSRGVNRDTQVGEGRVNKLGEVKSLTKLNKKSRQPDRVHSYEDLQNSSLVSKPIQPIRRIPVVEEASDSRRNVLIIEENESYTDSLSYSTPSRRRTETDITANLDIGSVNYDDVMPTHSQSFDKRLISPEKALQFVNARKAGLAYPKTRKKQFAYDIPLAATSACRSKNRIYCTMCYDPKPESMDTSLIDMTLKEEKSHDLDITSHQKLKLLPAYVSILIKEDLRRNKYSQKQFRGPVPITEGAEDDSDDMIITVPLIIPHPVMIHYTREKNLYEKDVDKLKHLGRLKKKHYQEVHHALAKQPDHKPKKVMVEIQADRSHIHIHARKPAILTRILARN